MLNVVVVRYHFLIISTRMAVMLSHPTSSKVLLASRLSSISSISNFVSFCFFLFYDTMSIRG